MLGCSVSRPDHYPHYGHWPLHWPSSHPLLPGEATTGHRPIWEYLGLFWTGSGFMTNWSGSGLGGGRGGGWDLDQLRHLITPPEMCPLVPSSRRGLTLIGNIYLVPSAGAMGRMECSVARSEGKCWRERAPAVSRTASNHTIIQFCRMKYIGT